MRNKQIKKFFIISSILIILISVFLYVFSTVWFELSFRGLVNETDCAPAFVYRGSLHTQEATISVGYECKKQNEKYTHLETFCVVNDEVYFLFSDESEVQLKRYIATINLNSMQFEKILEWNYAGRYISGPDLNYSEKNGYYYDGTIVLNDFTKVLTYDINSKKEKTYQFEEFVFPQKEIHGECINSQTITLFVGDQEKTFTLKEMAKNSKGIKKLYSLKNKKNYSNELYLSSFFNKYSIQRVNEKIYAVCTLKNFFGEYFAVILEYSENTWHYISKYHIGDIPYGKCFVIPS